MKNIILSAALGALLLAFSSSTASAAVVDCAGVVDVTTIGADGCQIGLSGPDFNNFTVSGGSVSIANASQGTAFVPNNYNLTFQLSPILNGAFMGDILLEYQTSGIQGVDIESFAATVLGAPGMMTVTEQVCTVAWVGSTCNGTLLANITGVSVNGLASDEQSATFTYGGTVYIKKDIDFLGAFTSEITNSQLVPEPMSLSLMGVGLLGLGLMGRRIRK